MAEETEHAAPASISQQTEAEIRELMGMFDVPSFARRGYAMESAIASIHGRCQVKRAEMLDMVQLRLKQWAQASEGHDAWRGIFATPIDELWPLSGAPEPVWAVAVQPDRRRKPIAKDLAASVARFNMRWTRFVSGIKLESVNELIDQYNTFYVLEKECVLGSSRLATRFFQPQPFITPEIVFRDHPLLPVIELV